MYGRGERMSDKIFVEVTDADLKALGGAIAALKVRVSTFGDTGSDLVEDLVPLKALRKRIIAAQATANI